MESEVVCWSAVGWPSEHLIRFVTQLSIFMLIWKILVYFCLFLLDINIFTHKTSGFIDFNTFWNVDLPSSELTLLTHHLGDVSSLVAHIIIHRHMKYPSCPLIFTRLNTNPWAFIVQQQQPILRYFLVLCCVPYKPCLCIGLPNSSLPLHIIWWSFSITFLVISTVFTPLSHKWSIYRPPKHRTPSLWTSLNYVRKVYTERPVRGAPEAFCSCCVLPCCPCTYVLGVTRYWAVLKHLQIVAVWAALLNAVWL